MKKCLSLDDVFSFSCHNGLKCFNNCCKNINLYLTPYDIIRLKKRLGISSEQFLDLYTIPLFMQEIGHPVVVLRMVDDLAMTCHFVTSSGCSIYKDRPWSCRIYPLEPGLQDSTGELTFTTVNNQNCLGLNKPGKMTVKKWRHSQNLAFYEEMNNLWAQVTLSQKMDQLIPLTKHQQEQFFMASYDMDKFREFVLDSEFLKSFEIEKKLFQQIQKEDIELFKLGIRWLKTVLFGESWLSYKNS
jgi:Fe-S-cluster containining protein